MISDSDFKLEYSTIFDSIENIILIKGEDDQYSIFNKKRNSLHLLEIEQDYDRAVRLLLNANVSISKSILEVLDTELEDKALVWDDESNDWIEVNPREYFKNKSK